MVQPNEIVSYHERLARACKELLQSSVVVYPPSLPRDLATGTRYAYTIDGHEAHRIETDVGRDAVCFRLLPLAQGHKIAVDPSYQETAWIGWFERWVAESKRSFRLEVAKWSVYWGYRAQKAKKTILRAEWDQTCFAEGDEGTAGQPHWHVDGDLAIGPGGIPTEADTIVPIHGVAIKKVHFGMAGWNHSREGRIHSESIRPCEHWQMPFDNDVKSLLNWSIRTLEYIQSQGQYLNHRDI